MSTDTGRSAKTIELGVDGSVGSRTFRTLALGSIVVLTASYVSVLREVTRVVGGTELLLALVGAMFVLATIVARVVRPRTATALAIVAAVAGFAYYLEAAGTDIGVVSSVADEMVADTLTLATGLPLLQMIEAGVWTLAFAPAPVFLSWYLALRGRYALAVVPGTLALYFLVLTGDAETIVTLLGTLAAIGAVGFGELARRGGSVGQADLVAICFAIIVALSLSVTFVPGGPATPATAGGTDDGTLEGAIDAAPERSGIAGSVDLSPETRFIGTSEQPTYWRTGVYDRYTGSEWLRSGQESEFDGRLTPPPGEYETVEQTVRAESPLGTIPAAAQPLSLEGDPIEDATVSSHGQPHPESTIHDGGEYTVQSAVVDPPSDELETAGTDYPEEIEAHYLQQPESTSSAFERRTAEITADAETPYETAITVEQYLRESYEYSLEVDQPDGDVAEAFLLEMDEGYCVYFGTTMVQMLRSEDVPARYVTGYTSGEEIDDDTYVVRGLDAHAWVEVYFPGHGWVPFEPTPPGDRDDVHQDAIEEPDPDAFEPDDEPDEPTEDEPGAPEHVQNDSADDAGDDDVPESEETEPEPEPPADTDFDTEPDDEFPISIPRETVALGSLFGLGLAAAIRRSGATGRARRRVGIYWHGRRSEPDQDVERAYRRLESLLARQYRPRRRGESPRRYLTALADSAPEDSLPHDPRLESVLEGYERAVYGGGVDRETAEKVIERVDELTRERLPVVGRR